MNISSDMRASSTQPTSTPLTGATEPLQQTQSSNLHNSAELREAADQHAQTQSVRYRSSAEFNQDISGCLPNLQSLQSSMSVDIYAVMAMAQKTAQEMRDANRELRASSLNAQVSELLSAADDMDKAAKFRLAAGIVQGAMKAAAGAATFGFNATAKGDGKGSETDRKEHSAKGDGISLGMQGLGDIAAAGLNYGASKADAEVKRHEAIAKLHESAQAEANDMMQQMMDVIRDVRDKVSAIDQSRIETNRGISRNI